MTAKFLLPLTMKLCYLWVAFQMQDQKILVSVKFLSAILGPEMGAPILWATGVFAFFLQESLHVHKIPRLGGGGGRGILGFFGGGGGVPILFLWARGFF